MNRDLLDQILLEATAATKSPAAQAGQHTRPWPVVLLSGLGAWLVALPMLALVSILLGDTLLKLQPVAYVAGGALLALAIGMLRRKTMALFVEQLAVAALVAGGAMLGYGLYRDLSDTQAGAVLALLACVVAWSVRQDWLRVLLGAVAAALAINAGMAGRWRLFGHIPFLAIWTVLHASVLAWIGAHALQRTLLNDGRGAYHAHALESVSAGWILATLAGLAAWSNMTFLLSGVEQARDWRGAGTQLASVLLTGAGAVWLARAWPSLRQWWCAGAALVLAALAWTMPTLGAVLLVLAFCAASRRWRVTCAAATAAAWIVGAFYYQLAWPLAGKAALFAAAGAVLGALAWLALRGSAVAAPWRATQLLQTPFDAPPVDDASPRARQAGIALGALAVLLVANAGIWQKEQVIAHGQAVYVALAPVDPRSLMQGDYMRLNFNLPDEVRADSDALLGAERPRLVAQRDERGIATLLRRYQAGTPLAPGEFVMELTPKNGQWTLVTDAWFFREGDATRYERARYGEFRVDADGRALLVGLRGAGLEAL